MAHLIDKDAVVAEIDKKIYYFKDYEDRTVRNIACNILNRIKQDINTLEVKEVDLDAEITKWEESFKHCPASMGYKETAKHFFELGLKAQEGE